MESLLKYGNAINQNGSYLDKNKIFNVPGECFKSVAFFSIIIFPYHNLTI